MTEEEWWLEGADKPESQVLVDQGDIGRPANGQPMSAYSKAQHALATGLFIFSFMLGDWWFDGSNGLFALINSGESILEMYKWIPDSIRWMTSEIGLPGVLVVLSWALWDLSPWAFAGGFIFSWTGGPLSQYVYTPGEPWEIYRQNAKKSYRFLLAYGVLLVVMDFASFLAWGGHFLDLLSYSIDFFSHHFDKALAVVAIIMLNPDYRLITSQ